MATLMAAPLVLIIFILIVGLVVWAVALETRKSAGNMRGLSEALGLAVAPTATVLGIFHREARASGRVRGKFVEVFSFSTGSGKSRTQWSAITATPKATGGLIFSIRPQNFGTRIMEVFGSKEIQLGDPEFDRRWFVQTNQPDFFRAALLPEMRAKITALVLDGQSRGAKLELENSVVRYAEIGSFSSAPRTARIREASAVVCDLADIAEVFALQGR